MYSAVKDDSVEAAAVAWVIRLDGGELSESERQQLDAWLSANPRHLGAFVRAQAIWSDADRVAALDAGRTAANPQPAQSARFANPMRRLLAASLAAMLVGGAIVAATHLIGREGTRFGEIRRLTLADGSTIVLNASSVVQIKFEKNERRVVLRAGEASFQVAHDVQRPFVVQAREVAVKAVGTSFSVRLRPAAVSVTVMEGVVEVMRPNETKVEEVKVIGRNRELIAPVAHPMAATTLTDREVTRQMAWQQGLLIFDGERLSQAVAEVNRYSLTPVVIDSDWLAQRAFVGVFRVGDARAFASAAAAAFDAHVDEQDDGLHLAE
jgi:transmembrane sensor